VPRHRYPEVRRQSAPQSRIFDSAASRSETLFRSKFLVQVKPQPLGDCSRKRFARNRLGARPVFDPRTAHENVKPLAAGVAARRSKSEKRHQPAEALATSAIQGVALAIGTGKSWRQHHRLYAARVASALQAMVLVQGVEIGRGPRTVPRFGAFQAAPANA